MAVPGISIGRRDPCSAGCGTFDSSVSSTIVSATYAADGTIQIKLDASNPIVFPIPDSPGTGPAFTWDPRANGIQMTSISDNAILFAGAGAGFLETVSSTGGNYTRVGNKSCSPSIHRGLDRRPRAAKPAGGELEATGLSEPGRSVRHINSYTIDYGDGSAAQTNSTGLFSHTFNSAGTYNAQLTVSDTAGKSSSNTAQRLITVTEAGKPDLIVSALTSGNTQPPVGTRVTLTATVKNQGAGSAGASQTQFLDGKASLGVVNTGALGPGASAQVSVNWTPAKKGKHTIQATADKNKVVAESNENNNSKSITINVR